MSHALVLSNELQSLWVVCAHTCFPLTSLLFFKVLLGLNFSTLSILNKVTSFAESIRTLFLWPASLSEPLPWIGVGNSSLFKSDILFYEQDALRHGSLRTFQPASPGVWNFCSTSLLGCWQRGSPVFVASCTSKRASSF